MRSRRIAASTIPTKTLTCRFNVSSSSLSPPNSSSSRNAALSAAPGARISLSTPELDTSAAQLPALVTSRRREGVRGWGYGEAESESDSERGGTDCEEVWEPSWSDGIVAVRDTDDVINSVVTGLGTGALYKAVSGVRSAAVGGVIGGIVVGAAVGGKQLMKRYMPI